MTKKMCIYMSMLLFLCVSFSISTAQMLSTPEMYQLIERRQRLLATQQIQTPKFPEPSAVAKIALPDTVVNISKEAYDAGLDYRQMSVDSLKYAKEFLDKGNIDLANKYINDSERLSKLSHSQIEASFRLLDGAIDMAQYKVMYEAAGRALNIIIHGVDRTGLISPYVDALITGIKLGVEYDVDKTLEGADKAKTELFKKAVVNVITEYVGAGKIAQKDFGGSRIYPVLNKLMGSSEFKEDVLKSFMRLGGTAAGYTADEALKFLLSLGLSVGDSPKKIDETKGKTTSTAVASQDTSSPSQKSDKQPASLSKESDKPKAEESKTATVKPGETPSASSSETPKQVTVTPTPAPPATDSSAAKKGTTATTDSSATAQKPTAKSASPRQETLDALQQKLTQLKETLNQLQEVIKTNANESIKKQVISNIVPIAKGEPVKIINMPKTLPAGLPKGKVADSSKLREGTAQELVTPVDVKFTQTFDGLFTQSANSPGSIYGTHSGTLTDGTRVNVKGDSIPGNFTGSITNGTSVGEPGYTPATHNNSAFSGTSVGTASAKGFKEGQLKGDMTVTIPAGTQTATVSGKITIETNGSLSMPSYSGPVTVNATGAKVGTMSGSWSQGPTR